MKSRCLLVDDEPIAIKIIQNHLQTLQDDFEVVATCKSAVEAFQILQKTNIDLIFCDIEMPQLTGIDFVKTLEPSPKVIFVTAHRDYAVESFALDVVDYLLKPVSFPRFMQAIQKYHRMVAKTPANSPSIPTENPPAEEAHTYLRVDRKMVKVNFSEILFVESLKDYVKVQTLQQSWVTKDTISNFETKLPASQFIRVHRSFIVAKNKVEAFTSELIEMAGFTIPISRSYRIQVLNQLQKPENT